MPKLSIIVPVYNAEKYLNDCIESIIGQTYSDFEVILVDDGSKDNSNEICLNAVKNNEKIHLIVQENKGVSSARNSGLNAAQGEYVSFIDADDIIHPQYYEKLITAINDKCVDLVATSYTRSQTQLGINNKPEKTQLFDQTELLEDLFSRPGKLVASSCNKVFKRELIGNIRFIDGLHFWEDLNFLMRLYSEKETIKACYLPENLYYYRENTDSVTMNKKNFIIQNELYQEFFYKYLRNNKPEYVSNSLYFYLDSLLVMLRKNRQVNNLQNIFTIKKSIIKWLIIGRLHGYLTRTSFHRFAVEGVIKG